MDAETLSRSDGLLPTPRGSVNDGLLSRRCSAYSIPERAVASINQLGWIAGCFVPVWQCIFGVILFERLSWIVGTAGVANTLVMFAVGFLLVFLSTLSMSQIASNGNIGGGGVYYMVSRALGPEFGGSIGLTFFLANVFGCTVYLLGFAEGVHEVFGMDEKWEWLVASAPLYVVGVICMIGADWFAKTSMVVVVVMVACMVTTMLSFMSQDSESIEPDPVIGQFFFSFTSPDWSLDILRDNLDGNFGTSWTFATVFAILYPAVTGYQAGANMSGDLKDPNTAIPKGTLLALLVSSLIYGLFTVVIGMTVVRDALADEAYQLVMLTVNFVPALFVAGLFLATLSSAMASIIGGAKIMQALARDNVLPLSFFSAGTQKKDEPVRAVILVMLIVQGLLASQLDLNFMASFQTLFFLLADCITCFACFALAVTGSPNWRPAFRSNHWSLSLLGTCLALAVMFVQDWGRSLIAVSVGVLLCVYVNWTAPVTTWGDVSQAIIYHQVRKYLLRLDVRKKHAKYWRPQVLALVSNPRSGYRFLQMANKLKKGGLLCVGQVFHGDTDDRQRLQGLYGRLEALKAVWADYIDATQLKAFPELCMGTTVRKGLHSLLMCSGLGALRPNSVMIGFPEESKYPKNSVETLTHLNFKRRLLISDSVAPFPPLRTHTHGVDAEQFVRIVDDILTANRNCFIARNLHRLPWYLLDDAKPSKKHVQDAGLPIPEQHTVDIWLHPLATKRSKNIALLLGYILHRTSLWRKHAPRLRLFSVVSSDKSIEQEREVLQKLLSVYRIPITSQDISVIVSHDLPSRPSLDLPLVSVDCPDQEVEEAMQEASRSRSASIHLQRPHAHSQDSTDLASCNVPVDQEHDTDRLTFQRDMAHSLQALNATIRRHTSGAAAVFLPIPSPPDGHGQQAREYIDALQQLTANLCTTIMVHANREAFMTTDI